MRITTFIILTSLAALAAAGCAPGRTREAVTFAVVADALLAAEAGPGPAPPPGPAAADRLARTIAELNDARDVRFVVFLGNLLADGQGPSLDKARALLGELKKPYFVVLGPEGLAAEPPAHDAVGASGPAPPPGGPATGHPTPDQPDTARPLSMSRALLALAFRGHGFDGPLPYWRADAGGGLILVAIYTAAPGPGLPGHVDAEQLAWLDRTLGQDPSAAVVILSYQALVSFHPFDNTYAWQDRLVDNRQQVLEVIARHPNVAAVLSAGHRFAAGRVVGQVVHLGAPALAVWPLAYDIVRLDPASIERHYVTVGTDDESRAAFDLLAADKTNRELFGSSERGEQRLIQVFGGRKTGRWNLNTLRP